uniref:ATP synthase subunit a n=1 Tax=Opimothrips tubulatus TaxID=2724111 RepID=A0A9E9EPQ3_9NEOP|nr:ATP synthase F0 subunit 6 [Opimothrips tubulatus]WAO28727.1 ATP synthase subunit 6 [Opimothrips tubulatus]
MLMNLFSSFDPTCLIFSVKMSLNFISSYCGFLYLPLIFWLKINRLIWLVLKINEILKNEFKLTIKGEKYNSYLIFISLFFLILMNNFLGLFPYIFTCTSHLSFNLILSFTFWFSFMMYGWLINTNKMFSHMLPIGTPMILMPMLVCIETISNIIRSGTLSIRLTANMISGHLLLTLSGNQGPEINLIPLFFLVSVQSILMILEISVSIIQSYVFSILSCLYSSESN